MHDIGGWQLYLLGGFRLMCGAGDVRPLRQRSASLLAFLALHPQQHSRDELAALFWADYPNAEARQSLRTALSDLRLSLGEQAVISGRQTVQIAPAFPLWVDAISFASQAERFLATPEPGGVAGLIELYRADLLPDFDHEWIIAPRERLRSLFLSVLLQATQEARSRSAYQEAIGYGQRVLALEPSNERAHQHLMFCYMSLGDRSAALRQYEACCAALNDDLGVEPLPETRRLRQWLAGQPAHRAPREACIGNLPVPSTSFVGRQQELAALLDMLRRSDIRLLTLSGVGGSGKTRLALELAAAVALEYSNGVFFVDLSALRQPDLLAPAIVQALGAQPEGGQSLQAGLRDFLREKQMLLVLDNFEQIIEAGPLLPELLSAAAQLKLLVTSRAALHLTVEHEYPLPPLPTPNVQNLPELAALSQCDAVALFIERASAVRPDFRLTSDNAQAIAEICTRLDGLPLAIELAATRTRLLSPQAMLARLDRRLDFLTGGPRDLPSRQKTLRAAIAWSYELLSPDTRTLFRRLAVFAGGWTTETAQTVCGGDALNGLAALVENSLVRRQDTSDGGVRFSMLETVREFAVGLLKENGEHDALRRTHALTFLVCAEDASSKLRGPGQLLWFDRMDAEYGNVRLGFQWAIDEGEADLGLRAARALWEYWRCRGLEQEALNWCTALLALPPDRAESGLRAHVMAQAANAGQICRPAEAWHTLSIEALQLARSSDDKRALAFALDVRARWDQSPSRQAWVEESLELYRDMGDAWGSALELSLLADIASRRAGNLPLARTLRQEALALARSAGDRRLVALVLIYAAHDADTTSQRSLVQAWLQEAIGLTKQVGDRTMLAEALVELAASVTDHREAIRLQLEAVAIDGDVGHRYYTATILSAVAERYSSLGDYESSARYVNEALALSKVVGNHVAESMSYMQLGRLAAVRGDFMAALRAERQSLRLTAQKRGLVWPYYFAVAELAHCAVASGTWTRAARLLGAVAAVDAADGHYRDALGRIGHSTAAVQEHMDDPAVAAAWADGAAMTIEEAGLSALKELDEEFGLE